MGIDSDREDCRSCDRLQEKLNAAVLERCELLEMLTKVIASGTDDWNVVEEANNLVQKYDATEKPVGLGDFCPEHGGLWSYKCQACVERLEASEKRKVSPENCSHDWSDVRHLVPSGVTDICFKCDAEKRNHVCEKCGAVQPPMSPQTFGVCQKCGAAFHYKIPG